MSRLPTQKKEKTVAAETSKTGKLLVFFDEPFFRTRREGEEVVTTNRAFWLFIRGLAPSFEHVFFLARISPEEKVGSFPCTPDPMFTLREVPFYESLYSAGGLLRSLPEQLKVFWRAVGESDTVLLGIPHPTCLILWAMARLRGRSVIFLDRQDLIARVEFRGEGPGKKLMVLVAKALVGAFVFLSRKTLTFAVGGEMYRRYEKPGSPAHTLLISLVREKDLEGIPVRELPEKDEEKRLLWVGRVDPDKGLEVLLQAFKQLLERNPQSPWHLDIVGSGLIEDEIAGLVRELGLEGTVHLRGFVPFGPELERYYDRATAYTLPSNESEGFPQVLIEGMARGLPIIATAVAGIPYHLTDGENAILLPPRNPDALTESIERLMGDADLYRKLSENGLRFAHDHTLEAQTGIFMREAGPYMKRDGRR